MPADAALLDTNVLIYALDPNSEFHQASRHLLEQARAIDAGLFITSQVLAEFYAVVTDARRVPKARQPAEALVAIEQILSLPGITLLPTPVDLVDRWMDLARRYLVSGQLIFDLQLAATMLAYDVRSVYTYNRADFERFKEITVLTPLMDA